MNENYLNITWMARDPAIDPHSLQKKLTEIFSFYDLNYAQWLPSDKTAAILDFGCGAGGLLKYLESRGYSKLTGFEPDTRYAKFTSNHLEIPIIQSANPLLFLKENEEQFDLVICRQVAYYFPRHEVTTWFESLAKLLKPQGRIIIEVFNGACFTAPWIFHKDPFIQFIFTEPLLRSLAETTGLKILFLGGDKIGGMGIKRSLWFLLRWLWAKILKTVYFIERGSDPTNPAFFTKSLVLVGER